MVRTYASRSRGVGQFTFDAELDAVRQSLAHHEKRVLQDISNKPSMIKRKVSLSSPAQPQIDSAIWSPSEISKLAGAPAIRGKTHFPRSVMSRTKSLLSSPSPPQIDSPNDCEPFQPESADHTLEYENTVYTTSSESLEGAIWLLDNQQIETPQGNGLLDHFPGLTK